MRVQDAVMSYVTNPGCARRCGRVALEYAGHPKARISRRPNATAKVATKVDRYSRPTDFESECTRAENLASYRIC